MKQFSLRRRKPRMIPSLVSLLVVLHGSLHVSVVGGEQAPPSVYCSGVCADGSPVGLPDKKLWIPGADKKVACGALDLNIQNLKPDTSMCQSIQSMGFLCGCPMRPDACTLCVDDALMQWGNRQLGFLDILDGITEDCTMVDAYLRGNYLQDDHTCIVARKLFPSYCGCSGTINDSTNEFTGHCSLCEDGSNVTIPAKAVGIEGLPFSTCGELEEVAYHLFEPDDELCTMFQWVSTLCGCQKKPDACNLCPDGGPISDPNRTLPFLAPLLAGMTPNCEVYEAFAESVHRDDERCWMAHQSSGICGCTPLEDHCVVCPGEELKDEYRDVLLDAELLEHTDLSEAGVLATCELIDALQYQMAPDTKGCAFAKRRRDFCGCNDGQFQYMRASTDQEKGLLNWLVRVSAMLSFFGTSAIVIDVLRGKQKREQTYNMLMASISICDALSSFGYVFAATAAPVHDLLPLYGEQGNRATCKTQAFLVQQSVTSLLFSVSLMAFYYLTIVCGWRTQKLKSIEKYALRIPAIVGLGLALAGIPYYDTLYVTCNVQHPPLAESWAPVVCLQLAPVAVAIGVCALLLIRVLAKARPLCSIPMPCFRRNLAETGDSGEFQLEDETDTQQPERTKPTLPTIRKVELKVAAQAVFYVAAFCLSWASSFVVMRRYDFISYNAFAALSFVTPLRGFFNSINYFQPRLTGLLHRRRQPMEVKETHSLPDEAGVATITATRKPRGLPDAADTEFNAITEPAAFLEAHEDKADTTIYRMAVIREDEELHDSKDNVGVWSARR